MNVLDIDAAYENIKGLGMKIFGGNYFPAILGERYQIFPYGRT